MKNVRIIIATLAALTVLTVGSVVAFAAPSSVAGTGATAAAGEYCPKPEKQRRKQAAKAFKAELKAFHKAQLAQRKSFFRANKSGRARSNFVRQQNAQRKAMQRRYVELVRAAARCD